MGAGGPAISRLFARGASTRHRPVWRSDRRDVPLDLMGGRSVFVTGVADGNQNVILETITQRLFDTIASKLDRVQKA